MDFQHSPDFARNLDERDPLRFMRDEFIIPPHGKGKQAYFLGNSLGLQPKNTAAELNRVLAQWADYGVEGFFLGDTPWLYYHDQLRQPLARIVGAQPDEIAVMNQLTVNLHLMMVSFYEPDGKKNKILCEAKAFPSDQYMFETHVRKLGLDPDDVIIELGPEPGRHTISAEQILDAIDRHRDELALVLWGGVNYYSGQLFDMAAITKTARAVGARVGFDLAHAAGNIPLKLHEWNVDFACWCSYKYLNAGPGAIGGVFVHQDHHHDSRLNRFAGWWGYDRETRFKMEKGFKPIATAEGWQLSTPSILLYAAHKASLDLFEKAGWEQLNHKREHLNAWLWWLLGSLNNSSSNNIVEFITPDDPSQRGCQVSMLMRKDGKKVFDALTKEGFITDWREPDVIRLAPVPSYNTYSEIWSFYSRLKEMLAI